MCRITRLRVPLGSCALLCLTTVSPAARAVPGATEVVSVGGTGTAAVVASCPHQCASSDGRFVVFMTDAPLVPGDTNGHWDVYVRDRLLNETRLVSATPAGSAGTGQSQNPAISANGRYVAFESGASDLVANDTNGGYDAFVRDLVTGVTERVSLTATGSQAPGFIVGSSPSISVDGRLVAFDSQAALVAGDSGETPDVYVRDRMAGTTLRASVRSDGQPPNGYSSRPSISDDGRFLAFSSQASDLTEGDTNGFSDVFVRDLQTGAIERVSVSADGLADGGYGGVISGNGRFVAFPTTSALVPDDTNGRYDIYVRDRTLKTTQRASLGIQARQSKRECLEPAISADGRLVAFWSPAANLVAGDTNHTADVFVRDLINGTTERASVATSGLEGNGGSGSPSISADGSTVFFSSASTNLGAAIPGALYAHERGGPQITSYTLAPSSLSFGPQTITTSRTLGVDVVNTGTVPIWVTSVSVSGPAAGEFLTTNVCHGWVQPTVRCRTGVTFTPTTTGGKLATLNVNAGSIVQSVPLSGTGVLAAYTASPTSLAFGSIAVGLVSTAKTVTITNTGSSVLPLKSITLIGAEASQFRRANRCGNIVAAGSACTVRVRFAPTSVGAHQATLAITAGGGGGKQLVTVSGTGL